MKVFRRSTNVCRSFCRLTNWNYGYGMAYLCNLFSIGFAPLWQWYGYQMTPKVPIRKHHYSNKNLPKAYVLGRFSDFSVEPHFLAILMCHLEKKTYNSERRPFGLSHGKFSTSDVHAIMTVNQRMVLQK